MALTALLIWLFFSPHRHAEEAAALDRKREFPFLPWCSRFCHQHTFQLPYILQSSSRKLFRIPILRISAHHRILQCGVLHDIRNASPRQFCIDAGNQSRHLHNRYEARGGSGEGVANTSDFIQPRLSYTNLNSLSTLRTAGSNLLRHRYLLERAAIMKTMYGAVQMYGFSS